MWYLRWNIPASKRVSCLRTAHTEDNIFYNVVFDEIFYSALAYTSQPCAEAMAMRQAVSYIPYATSSREKTRDITTFTQFEEGNLLSETRDDTESGKEYDDDSNLPPLFNEYYADMKDAPLSDLLRQTNMITS